MGICLGGRRTRERIRMEGRRRKWRVWGRKGEGDGGEGGEGAGGNEELFGPRA